MSSPFVILVYMLFLLFLGASGTMAGTSAGHYFSTLHPVLCIIVGMAAAGVSWLFIFLIPSVVCGIIFSILAMWPLLLISRDMSNGDMPWMIFWTIVGALLGCGIGWLFSEVSKGRLTPASGLIIPEVGSRIVFSIIVGLLFLLVSRDMSNGDVLWMGFWGVIGALLGFGIGQLFAEFAKLTVSHVG